jgi:DNA modification methylase
MGVQDVISGRAEWAVPQGDTLSTLRAMPDGCVQVALTSPPYWALRSYLPADDPLKVHELGSEPTPELYVANMVKVFREVRRVLREDGVLWLNVGDCFASGELGRHDQKAGQYLTGDRSVKGKGEKREHHHGKSGLPAGSLLGIPWRLAFALQADGWVLRNDVVWGKTAPMPESLSGWRWERCRVKVKAQSQAEEAGLYAAGSGNRRCRPGSGGVTGKMPEEFQTQWEPCPGCDKCRPNDGLVLRRGSWRHTRAHEEVFMLVKSASYFCDGEAVRTPPAPSTVSRDKYTRILDDPDEQFSVRHDHETACVSGANPRSVMMLGPEPNHESHYAAFPTGLAAPLLRASTSEKGCCPSCGSSWVRVVERGESHWAALGAARGKAEPESTPPGAVGNTRMPNGTVPSLIAASSATLSWCPSCACPPAEPVPQIVLDPFAGTSTTGVVCRRLGLRYVGCELNPKYVEMSEKRLRSALRTSTRPRDDPTPQSLFAEDDAP